MTRNSDSKIKILWEERSNKYKDNILGVLYKSFPMFLNKYIDDWEFKLISKIVINRIGFNILDIGCGYGRISMRILKKFNNVKLFGIDIAQKYVDIYNQKLNPRGIAINADMRKLPFNKESFDFVIIVASLMYVIDKKEQKNTLLEVFRVLKKGGRLLIIERDVSSYNLITLWGLISKIRGNKYKEINAVGYEPEDIYKLIEGKGILNDKFGIPLLTLFLPLLIFFNMFSSKYIVNLILKIINRTDSKFRNITYPSLYIAYVISKK